MSQNMQTNLTFIRMRYVGNVSELTIADNSCQLLFLLYTLPYLISEFSR